VHGQRAKGGTGQTDLVPNEQPASPAPDLRPELAEVERRRHLWSDEARPAAVERRHARGRRTVREDLADLIDEGSWDEYGGFAVAARRGRRSIEELITSTPGDGVLTGLARINGEQVGAERARAAVVAYDYTVLAGTQGMAGHAKTDRMLSVVEQLRVPVVLLAEGGGGRPGDTDYPVVAGLHLMTFASWARLSGVVPRIAVAAGRCFAGNATLFGSADITIATEGSSIGMAGPAMIEGGGLGVVEPDAVGPMDVQTRNGVVDVLVADDAAAMATARRALSYFQGRAAAWSVPDQAALREAVPENRRRAYDVRTVIRALADEGSVLELGGRYARAMTTALARLDGAPVGILANNPLFSAGAITADAAEKASRFLTMCDAFDLPILSLCDTPGFMVGPDAERTGLVRRAGALFNTVAGLQVPLVTVVLRKGYGLGAMAMAGGSFHAGRATLAWPTGEFGGMNLEGAVRLGMRRELDAIEDAAEREQAYQAAVDAAYEQGKALNTAMHLEIDDVIDPTATRGRVTRALLAGTTSRGEL
jgi:acetyl-CoA carboxylase carboxyltransferase component